MIVVAILYITLGLLIKKGKMYSLIAGYNTMPDKEKALVNIAALATLFRNVMFAMALALFAGAGLSYWLNNTNIETACLIVTNVKGVPYLLIRPGSKKYRLDK